MHRCCKWHMAKGVACGEGDKIARRVMSGWRVEGVNGHRVSKLARWFGANADAGTVFASMYVMKHHLDWSSYETAGQGDAYAGIPATGGDFAKAVAVCISDKLCQRTPKGVMCPSFRVTDDAAHSPGGRVVVLKAALNGELGSDAFADPSLAAAMELCVGCKGCKRECANQVDMAALKIEYQAQRNALQGVPDRDHLIAVMPGWLRHRRLMRS